MTDKTEQDDILTKNDLENVRQWFLDNDGKNFPPEIVKVILMMVELCLEAQDSIKSNKKLLALLRQHMGFVPTKERDGKNEKPTEIGWNKETEDKLCRQVQRASEKLREYRKSRPPKPPRKKRAVTKGAEGDNAGLEPVFSTPAVQTQTEIKELHLQKEDHPLGMIAPSRSFQERTRFDLSLCLKTINYSVETISCAQTGISKTAKVEDGPARFRVTWEAISQIAMMVAGMGIPMVRLAATLQTVEEYFSPTRIYRLLRYLANACAAIYIQIFKDLASCDVLNGDDTGSCVLEMRKDEEQQSEAEIAVAKEALAESLKKENPQEADLPLEIANFLGGQRCKKNSNKLKGSVFTTVVIGCRSRLGYTGNLVFYYTERKSFGDLLGKILAYREDNKENAASAQRDQESQIKQFSHLVIQSDLSTQNIPNPYPTQLQPTFAGCAAHARRPFWRFRKDSDPEVGYYCFTMLLLFEKIFDSDRDARETGDRNAILKARKKDQAQLWEEIKTHCEEMKKKFAPNSDMAKAAAYVLNNYGKLTYYLNDLRIKPDNNQSERLLRFEKIMHDNSKFRVSKRGRLAYDILRTILGTCSATGVNAMEYFVFIMKNQIAARKNPSAFTPYAYASIQNQNPTV
jgi:hypothetical protein